MALKLMIAEDEDVIRNSMAKYIRLHTDRFAQIYLASNGQEAIDTILTHRPDIMLLDIQMPGKTGIDVMRETREAGAMPLTIILSGYDDFKYAQQGLRMGARDYMLKPSRSSDILKAIHALADELEGEREDMDEGEVNNNMVKLAMAYINEHYHENIDLPMVADAVGISAGYLSTLFTQNMKVGFIEYLNNLRVDHACAYLKQGYFKTYEIAYKVGFRDDKYFTKVFKKVMGMSPSDYKKMKDH